MLTAPYFPFLFYYSSPRIAALPDLAWLQIVLVVALLDNSVVAQDPSLPRASPFVSA